MRHVQIVNEELLNAHSDLVDIRGLLPEIMFRLILASLPDAQTRVPSMGSIGQSGSDAIVNTNIPFEPYVPEGTSYWEMGSGNDPAEKASQDFRNRTKSVSPEERANSTFVFVTPRSATDSGGWPVQKQRDWIRRRKKRALWKEILVLDGTNLREWIFRFPAIDLWLAEQLGIDTQHLETPQHRWQILRSYGHPPYLSPDIFLADRQDSVQSLEALFKGDTMELRLETRYPDEGVDFLAAYLASRTEADAAALSGRTLILGNPAIWKSMCSLQQPHVFVASPRLDLAGADAELRQYARQGKHACLFFALPLSGSHGNTVRLPARKAHRIQQLLEDCGYNSERARQIASKCDGKIPALKRLLQDLAVSPHWAGSTAADELAIAALIGRWDGNNRGDREAIESLPGKPYMEWIGSVRASSLEPDPPIVQRNEIWSFTGRFEGLQFLGKYLGDHVLDTFAAQAKQILSEVNPAMELATEDRWLASIKGKSLQYSNHIRQGISEGLAIIGSHPSFFSSCSTGKSESISADVVRGLIEDRRDWQIWASLSDVFPLLAEAAPDQFLQAIETQLKNGGSVFSSLFQQEQSDTFSVNYMTGILWALESLAWTSDYLARVSLILLKLHRMDPGGNYANRPLNSLIGIFRVWFPQTCAGVAKRITTVSILLEQDRETGWELIMALLPRGHDSASPNHKPSWRDFIPEDHQSSVTHEELSTQIIGYSNLAVELALGHTEFLPGLIERLNDLPDPARNQILSALSSDLTKSKSDQEKLPVWEALENFVAHHRYFSDAAWAVDSSILESLEEIGRGLAPEGPELRNRRLFTEEFYRLTLKGDKGNWQTQAQEVEKRRDEAASEILGGSGLEGLIQFASSVKDKYAVGIHAARVSPAGVEAQLFPALLASEDPSIQQFIAGFAGKRFHDEKWEWVNALSAESWSDEMKLNLLLLLPFEKSVWKKASELLGSSVNEYWKQVHANEFSRDENLLEAVENLITYGRPQAAIRFLHRLIPDHPPPINLIFQALRENVSSSEARMSMDSYHTVEVIKWLQDNSAQDERLSVIEWQYLGLLDQNFGGAPVTLTNLLSTQAEFFCQVLRTIFRGENAGDQPDPDEEDEDAEGKATIAHNAFKLLQNWKTVPGTQPDGSFDGNEFEDWISQVKSITSRTGHWNIAQDQLARSLIYAPKDSDGLWVHRTVARILNEEGHSKMRTGYKVAFVNSRGVYYKTGGKAEAQIATSYRTKAEEIENAGFVLLAATIRELASDYDRMAEQEAQEDED